MTWANSSVTVTRMLQTKFEVNLLSSFREEDDCWRMTTDAGASPFDTNSSPWAFGSGELKIQKISTQKYPGAQLHVLSNNFIRFHDSRSNTFLVTCDTSWKLKVKGNNYKNTKYIHMKIPGAQLHMLIKIPVRFHDSRSITFWASATQKGNRWTEGRTRVNLNAPPPPYSGGTKK
jgi:hypothetical protein